MKLGGGFLAVVLAATPAISYFKYERQIQAATSGGQHYAVVDETVWRHARPDLGDLRLYAAGGELPFALTMEMGNSESEQEPLRILQPGTVGGKTQFLLDMTDAPEYDRVQLNLATKNFIAHALVQGQDDLHGKQWATLGTTTLYDLTAEKLGHNSALQIPLSAYRYLRVTVDAAVKPAEVESATAGATRAEKAQWREVAGKSTGEQQRKETVFLFTLPENVPVERLSFTIDPLQPNFRRSVEILSDRDQEIGIGEISRIHMQRGGQKIDAEQLTIQLRIAGPAKVRVLVHNGDDVPVKIVDARLLQYERRIYFDADAGVATRLYYGDEMLSTPVYDYRKLFQKDAGASQLRLDAEILNAAYTGRPDERPWSERYPAVLWVAIIAAVLILGGLAFRSLKSVSN
jgi:hypothetical protein